MPYGMRDCEGHGAGPADKKFVISPTMCGLIALIQACVGVTQTINGGLKCMAVEIWGNNLLADSYLQRTTEQDANDTLSDRYPHHKHLAELAATLEFP